MPYQVSIEQPIRTIVIIGTGSGTTADTLQLIEDVLDTLKQHPDYNLLYDSRQLDINSSPADMMRVAAALFGGAGIRIRRMAVVVPAVRIPLARVFTALANDHQVRANVFSDPSEAYRWLALP